MQQEDRNDLEKGTSRPHNANPPSKLWDYITICILLFLFGSGSVWVLNSIGFFDNDSSNMNDKHAYTKEDIRDMCQFLEYDYTGVEGDDWLKSQEFGRHFKLRSMLVTFRHGERSPISPIEDKVGCRPVREVDRQKFEEYKELADSDDVIDFLKIDPLFASYHRYPEDANCVAGNLTAEGALQHLKLGRFFREKYTKSGLLGGDAKKIVVDVSTSKYYRTFQSVLAFSTEFFYPLRSKIDPILVKAATSTSQCLDDFCHCPVLVEMRHKYEHEHLAVFEQMAGTPIKQETEQVLSTFEAFSQSPDPFKIIDVALGKYVCRRRNLPCVGEKCVTIDYINKIIEVAADRAEKMFDNKVGITQRLLVVESYPVLEYLRQTLEKIRLNPESNFIRIFSAHDSVVGPIVRTLGIPFVDPPHYTARLVFEIYEHDKDGMFIRFLYNGENRSKDVRFCRGKMLKYGMCRVTAFEQFMNKGIFKMMGTHNFKDACYL